MIEKKITSKNIPLLMEIFVFLRARRIWWLAPAILLLILASALIIFIQSNSVSPLIYALI